MHIKTLTLIPAATLILLSLTACGASNPTPSTTAPAVTPAPSFPTTPATSPALPPRVTPSATPATTATDKTAAIAALESAGDDWYNHLGPDLKDKVYPKASSARLVPKGTIIKAYPDTWQPHTDNPNQADIKEKTTYPGGHSSDYDVTMVKINGKWLINFTIADF